VSDLIPIDEARRRVLEAVRPLGDEDVALDLALGRVLAEDVTSGIDVPPFDSSGMDGYALIAGPEAELEVIGEARAGHPAFEAVRPGTAIRISTGAVVPEGANAVVPVERTTAVKGAEGHAVEVDRDMRGKPQPSRVRVAEIEAGANIRRAGEDIVLGAVVLPRGAVLGPAELGVAASVGRSTLRCALQPRVFVLITGDGSRRAGSTARTASRSGRRSSARVGRWPVVARCPTRRRARAPPLPRDSRPPTW
jgi:molybdopterin molybdotransferase